MKQCPRCKRTYSDTDTFCNVDGSALVSIAARGGKRNKLILYIAVALAFLGLLAVNMIPFLMESAASNCKVTLKGISIKNKSPQDILGNLMDIFTKGERNPDDIALILAVKNDNMVSFTILDADVNLYVNSRQAAYGKLSGKKIKIGAWDETDIRLPLDISWRAIPAMIGNSEIRCSVKGNIKLDTFLGIIKRPIDMEGLNIPVS